MIYDKRGQEYAQYKLLTMILGNDGLEFFRKTFNSKGLCFSYLLSPYLSVAYHTYDYLYTEDHIRNLDVDPTVNTTKPCMSSSISCYWNSYLLEYNGSLIDS